MKKDSKPYNGTAVFFCVLRPHIFSVKKVMGLSLFCGEKEAVSFCDVSVF